MSLEVEYIDAPYGAQEDGSSAGQNQQPFSSDILGQTEDVPFATLEDGIWRLDGKMRTFPDNPKEIGFWSKSMSDKDGRFSANPKITITFPKAYSSSGLTFTFSPSTNQWCSEIKVSWFNKQTQLRTTTYHPDAPRWLLEELVESFDRIIIEIISTNKPFQFAKIQKIMIGQSIHFGRNEIISAKVTSEADHKLCELTVDTMKLEIHDRKMRKLLPQEKQRVELYQNGNLVAVHYIHSSTRESPFFYTMSCQSAIGNMEDTFLGGIYNNVSLEAVLKSIFGRIRYELSSAFNGVTVSGYLPVCTRREALQQVAFAIGAVVTTHGTDAVKLDKPQEIFSTSFSKADIFTGAKVETGNRYARVEVASHSYMKSNEKEDILPNEYINGKDVLITFNEPYHEYSIVGGTITASGDNWVTVTASGNVSISAKKYIHGSVMHSRRNTLATANEQPNVLTVDKATLVTNSNVNAVLNRLYDASLLRFKLKQDAVIHGQKCGDRVSSINPWNTQTRGFITSMASTYTQGGHTADITIAGIEVETEGVYYYSGELYSGDKEVVY